MKKLPKRYVGIVMPLVLSFMMTFIVSGVSLLRTIGFNGEMLHAWPLAWMMSWAIAFPALLLLLPVVRRVVAVVVE